MDSELWDPARRRLTVLLDPARIKQGLAPHREAGYPLQEGTTVVLVVDRDFCDAAGLPLLADRRQPYHVGQTSAVVSTRRAGRSRCPEPAAVVPLVARFDRALDRALLEDCLTVVGSGGTVPGAAHIVEGERSWSFVPDARWTPGPKAVLVDPVLEDVAGNSLERIFDRNLHRPDHEPLAVAAVQYPSSSPATRPRAPIYP